MNGGGTSAGLSGASLQQASEPREETARERDGEQAAALWVALAQQLGAAERLPLAVSAGQPTSAWHPSAGDMTLARGVAPAAGDAPLDPKPAERMTLRVDGGALGELEVTLDRQDGGLRVVIGMENQGLVGAVLPDAATLRSALQSAGITVQSLNVVPQSEVGTVLAQRRPSPSGQKSDAEAGAEADREKAQKRTHKRLTLIG